MIADQPVQGADQVEARPEILDDLEVPDGKVDHSQHREHDQPPADAEPPRGLAGGQCRGRRQQRDQRESLDDS